MKLYESSLYEYVKYWLRQLWECIHWIGEQLRSPLKGTVHPRVLDGIINKNTRPQTFREKYFVE
jgi:hypothetical protein